MCHVRECVGGMLPSGRHTLGAELLCSGKVPGGPASGISRCTDSVRGHRRVGNGAERGHGGGV